MQHHQVIITMLPFFLILIKPILSLTCHIIFSQPECGLWSGKHSSAVLVQPLFEKSNRSSPETKQWDRQWKFLPLMCRKLRCFKLQCDCEPKNGTNNKEEEEKKQPKKVRCNMDSGLILDLGRQHFCDSRDANCLHIVYILTTSCSAKRRPAGRPQGWAAVRRHWTIVTLVGAEAVGRLQK